MGQRTSGCEVDADLRAPSGRSALANGQAEVPELRLSDFVGHVAHKRSDDNHDEQCHECKRGKDENVT